MDEKINPTKGTLFSDHQAISLAIKEAFKGASFVSPNPLVGCVILDSQNKFLASGFHGRYGGPHAEVDAFSKLTSQELENSQFFVTLEPCAHQGKTPSCAQSIAKMKIKKLVYGLRDPFPLVAGKGAQILKDAGVDVVEYQGELKTDLENTAEVFLKNTREQAVFVAMKVASSLDGQIAMKSGESKWITSDASREFVHELRSWYDGILVGRKTVEVDDPSLDIRHPRIKKSNKLVIIDPDATLLKQIEAGREFKFLKTHPIHDIYFACRNYESTRFQTVHFFDLPQLMAELWKRGMRSVFVEGGAATYSQFLNENLVDRLHLFMAPALIGAGGGIAWTENFSVASLNDKLALKISNTQQFGPDFYLTGRFERR